MKPSSRPPETPPGYVLLTIKNVDIGGGPSGENCLDFDEIPTGAVFHPEYWAKLDLGNFLVGDQVFVKLVVGRVADIKPAN